MYFTYNALKHVDSVIAPFNKIRNVFVGTVSYASFLGASKKKPLNNGGSGQISCSILAVEKILPSIYTISD